MTDEGVVEERVRVSIPSDPKIYHKTRNPKVVVVVVKLHFNSPDAQALLPSRCGR